MRVLYFDKVEMRFVEKKEKVTDHDYKDRYVKFDDASAKGVRIERWRIADDDENADKKVGIAFDYNYRISDAATIRKMLAESKNCVLDTLLSVSLDAAEFDRIILYETWIDPSIMGALRGAYRKEDVEGWPQMVKVNDKLLKTLLDENGRSTTNE